MMDHWRNRVASPQLRGLHFIYGIGSINQENGPSLRPSSRPRPLFHNSFIGDVLFFSTTFDANRLKIQIQSIRRDYQMCGPPLVFKMFLVQLTIEKIIEKFLFGQNSLDRFMSRANPLRAPHRRGDFGGLGVDQ
jgi:hypothetical protein